jgi:hypothetical protein
MSLSKGVIYVYTYTCRERERERERFIHDPGNRCNEAAIDSLPKCNDMMCFVCMDDTGLYKLNFDLSRHFQSVSEVAHLADIIVNVFRYNHYTG